MEKYSWNTNYLQKRREKLKRQIKHCNELLNMYDEMLENCRINPYPNMEFDNTIILPRKSISITSAKCIFDSIPKERIKLIKNAICISKNYDYSVFKPQHEILELSDVELIEETRKLFEQLPNKLFFKKFDEFTNQNNKLLQIMNYKKLNLGDALGTTYIDTETHTPYGCVARHYSICDIVTLAHEIFHMIIRQQEGPFFSDSNKTVFTEVEGWFADLLFSELLKNSKYSKENIDDFDRFDLTLNLDNIETIFTLDEGFKLMNQSGKINFNKLRKILVEKGFTTPINSDNFTMLIDYGLFDDVDITVSYLTALDLFNKYQSDPEKALSYLKLIPQLTGDNPKKDLASIECTFFEDGYQILDKQCKKLLKTKTTSK